MAETPPKVTSLLEQTTRVNFAMPKPLHSLIKVRAVAAGHPLEEEIIRLLRKAFHGEPDKSGKDTVKASITARIDELTEADKRAEIERYVALSRSREVIGRKPESPVAE